VRGAQNLSEQSSASISSSPPSSSLDNLFLQNKLKAGGGPKVRTARTPSLQPHLQPQIKQEAGGPRRGVFLHGPSQTEEGTPLATTPLASDLGHGRFLELLV
jgi:hypothetical protein